jgi:hypothetical protein
MNNSQQKSKRIQAERRNKPPLKLAKLVQDLVRERTLAEQAKMKFMNLAAEHAIDPEHLQQIILEEGDGDFTEEVAEVVEEYKRVLSTRSGK